MKKRNPIIIDFNKVYRNKYGDYKILEDLGDISGSHLIKIRFVDANMYGFFTERIAQASQILTENIVDPYKPTVLGVACKGNAETSYNGSPYAEYNLWKNMIEKCYGKKKQSTIFITQSYGAIPSKITPTVCYRWLCYEYFLYDLPYIPNNYLWRSDPSKYELSITTIGPMAMKEYSINTCIFGLKMQRRIPRS